MQHLSTYEELLKLISGNAPTGLLQMHGAIPQRAAGVNDDSGLQSRAKLLLLSFFSPPSDPDKLFLTSCS